MVSGVLGLVVWGIELFFVEVVDVDGYLDVVYFECLCYDYFVELVV